MTDTSPLDALRRPGVPRALAGITGATILAAVLTGATGGVRLGDDRVGAGAPAAVPAPRPVVTVVTVDARGQARWDRPLTVAARDGALAAVTVTDGRGRPLPGTVGADGAWRSTGTVLPAATYSVRATATDRAGRAHEAPLTVRTAPAAKVLRARVSPGDGAVVGVGMPVVVRLDRPVRGRDARASVERRLGLRTAPAVEGSWRWMSDTEVHYRPATYWAPGTVVTAAADLRELLLPGGVWGSGYRRVQFTIGARTESVVDVAAHTMTVTRDGKVLRVMKASMGKPGYETRNGTHIVLEKFTRKVMDAGTLGVSRSDPDYYRTAVNHAVRITNSGTFTHAAPWSLTQQGVANVSHGCINLSPADARWFHDLSRRGDLVRVVGSTVPPRLWDAGTAEWNMDFATWRSGSALA